MFRSILFALSLLAAIAASFANEEAGFESPVPHRFVSSESQPGDIAYQQIGPWTAITNADWLAIDSGTGSGLGSITYTVEGERNRVSS